MSQQPVIEIESVACELCGSRHTSLVQVLTDRLYHLPGTFTLQRCQQCDLMYLNPRPTPESIGFYYPPDYAPYRPPIEDERWAVMRFMRRRKMIKRRQIIEKYSGLKQGRILDVGCATGLFLREMQLAGWQAAGIEPISSAAELARRRFGLEVFEGWLRDAPFAASSFDVLTFWDVLEHTFSPRSDLSQAARLLRSGGLLAINIPNWDSFDRRPFGANWQGFDPPRHLYMFSRETLTRLLTETGFEILGWVCFMPGFFAWTLSVKRQLEAKHWRWRQLINWTLALPGIRLLFEPWFAWMNWRGKGPVISVLARRVGTI